MPDNRLGSDEEIPAPRNQPVSGSNDFGIMRAMDGHRMPPEDEYVDADFTRNPHEPGGDMGYSLVEVAIALLVIVVAVVILLRVL